MSNCKTLKTLNFISKKLARNARRGRTFFDLLHAWLTVQAQHPKTKSPLITIERWFWLAIKPWLTQEKMVVYDIGAAEGNVTVMLAKLTNVEIVYAFEPILGVFEHLRERAKEYPNVNCYNVALGDENGSATFHQNDSTDSSSMLPLADLHRHAFPKLTRTTETTVTVARLDDFVFSHSLRMPYFVKVDVQGFEDRVLRGGQVTIQQASVCMIEMSFNSMYEGSVLFDDLYAVLTGWGFRFAGIAGQVRGPDGEILQIDGVFVKPQQFPS